MDVITSVEKIKPEMKGRRVELIISGVLAFDESGDPILKDDQGFYLWFFEKVEDAKNDWTLIVHD